MKPPPLWLCAHECGHAVAKLVLDELPPCPGRYLQSVSVIAEPDSLGRVKTQDRVMYRTGFSRAVLDKAYLDADRPDLCVNHLRSAVYEGVQIAAGFVAEMYWRGGPFAPLFFSDRIKRAVLSTDEDGDLLNLRNLIDWIGLPNTVKAFDRFWRLAYDLIWSEWPGLVRVARVLQQREFMEGEDFESCWRAGRSNPAVRQQRDASSGWRERVLEAPPDQTAIAA